MSRENTTQGKPRTRVDARARGAGHMAEQRALPLRHKRRRPTLAYVRELELRVMVANSTIEILKREIRSLHA